MSFINLGQDINEIKEPETVPEGMYDLVIEKVMEKKNEQGDLTGLNVILDVSGYVDAAPVFHHVSLPHEDDDEDKTAFKLRFLKKFLDAFIIPFTKKGFDMVDFAGATGKVKLILDEYQGTINNKIKI